MSCTVNRWGPGTTCEKPRSTELAKEMQSRITAMNQERAKQDTIWNLPSDSTSLTTITSSSKTFSTHSNGNTNTANIRNS